ncbi:MAG TPA: FimV/HubP family polar landmark protein [Steroidobacteraceae bacterium]|nr:FimV/HubP family polar landmark protein [Steroidobacteraceae bacterium]
MFAKRSTRALALLLALPSAAFALGLGDIRLLSPLNAPLDAEIELLDVAPDEINTLQVQLASRDTFAKYGLDWPPYLNTVQVKTVRTPDGREIVKLKSVDPISEPFVTLLVEVNWSRGHMVREYTMLLDPPVYTPSESQVASAPVTAPTTGQGAREGAIARTEPTPPPAPVAAPSEQAAAAPTEQAAPSPSEQAAPAANPAPAQARSRPERPARTETPTEEGAQSSSHLVHRGETLSGIAAGVAGVKLNSAKARSWMLAIYQANPEAFRQNMNVLRSGAVLRIPEASAAEAVSPSEATAEIRRQYAAWRSETPGRTASAAQPGRLKLVTPSEAEPAAANATPPSAGGSTAAKPGAGAAAAAAAAEQNEKRLLELRNQELARMQSQTAAKQGEAATPPAATARAPTPPPPTSAPAPAEQPPPAAATEQPPPAAETAPAPAPAVEEKPAPPPVAQPPVKKPAAASGGSFLDTLLGYWWVLLALVAVGLLAFFAARVLRSRRKSEFDDSLGRLAAAGAEAVDFGSISAGRGFAAPEPAPRVSPSAAPPDSAFLVEETGSHERPRISATGSQTAITTAKHVASDETISSETAINLDQGDPLAEADFHMAYGLYDQAADLIRIAITREPARRDLKLKLLEVFFVWGNKEQFLASARELAESRSEAAPGEWEKILIMGKQLAPEDPLFSGGGAVAGATAGGVDLDLEGGQSRVDFDLLGDPAPGEGGGGVDLDIGAAVGDLDATAESQSNITDRNVALMEGSFAGGGTGTTRQMTARVRQNSGSTHEMEGPTVEQPALVTPSQPTIRQKVETALRKGGEQTQELALDDLGLDMGGPDTVDQPGIAAAANSTPDAPTLVAGLDEQSRRVMEDAHRRAKEETGETTGAWQFDQDELEAALTQTSAALPDPSSTARMRALGRADLDVDVGDATGTHAAHGEIDLDVGAATGTHQTNGGLDLDVGTATVPDAAFAATQRLASDELALPDLEPVTMSEVGTKLDLARAYMDMGDPDGARNILEEVLTEGSAAQKQEAQRLIESLPG